MLSSGSEGASLQALKLEAASIPTSAQGLKLQAKILKRNDPMTRVQAAPGATRFRARAYKLSSHKRQASQPEAKGSSFKPKFASARIP